MLPVSLRLNISIVHLFLFTLIPKHTPKKKKKKRNNFLRSRFLSLEPLMVPPDQQLTVGTIHALYGI